MSLTVNVKSASNLPNVERFSKSDPMAVIVFQGIIYILMQLQAKIPLVILFRSHYCSHV